MAKQSFKGIAIVTESIYEELKSQGKIDPNLLYVEDLFVKSPKKISDLEKDDNTIVRTTGDYNITGIKQFELIKLTESLQDENGENILDFTNGNINFGNSNIMLLLKGSQERPYYNNSENTLAFISDIPSVVDALNSQDSSKTLSANQGRILNEKITNIVETLNSKNQAFTIQSLSDLGTLFNIDITEIKNEYGVETSTITYKDKTYTLKNGDVFLIVDANVPDYWFSLDDMTIYRMETSKVDLSNYVTKDDLKTLQDEVDKKLSIEDYVVDSELSDSSENPVQNKVIDAKVKEVKQSILTVEEKIPTTYVKSITGESGEVSGIATEQFVKDKINEIPTPGGSVQIEEHNEDEEAHPYIRNLIPTDYYKVKNKLSSVDLNTIVIPGNYGVANTCINLPVSGATGTMFVGNYLNNTYAQQLFITSDNIMYIRSSTNIDNTNWTEWAKTASDNELKIIQDSMPKDLSDLANVADGVVDNQYATKKYVKDYVVDITASELEGYVSGLNYYSEDVFNVTTDPTGEPNKSYDYYPMDYDKNMAIQPIIGEEVQESWRRASFSSRHPFITACTYNATWDTEAPKKITFEYTGETNPEINNGNVSIHIYNSNAFYASAGVMGLENNTSYYVKIISKTLNGDNVTQDKNYGMLYLSYGWSSSKPETNSNGMVSYWSDRSTEKGKFLPRRKINEYVLNVGEETNPFLVLNTLLPETTGWKYEYTIEIRKAESDLNKILENKGYVTTDGISDFITKDVNDLTNYTLTTDLGQTVELSVDSSTYVMTANLKKEDGTVVSTTSVDLPLESMVVSAEYLTDTKEIQLTLQNGSTTKFSVADLVSGLATTTELDKKMNKSSPEGTGNLSINRKSSTTVGSYSSTLGYNGTASGQASNAEGYGTTASGKYAHSEGYNTTATKDAAHAEGYESDATGTYSHAEGYHTTASGSYSHAEGYYTEATQSGSHAEGSNTKAKGYQSHAEGLGTIACTAGQAQHVFGTYNVEDTATSWRKTFVEIVGIGSSDTDRVNGRTLDRSGNQELKGQSKAASFYPTTLPGKYVDHGSYGTYEDYDESEREELFLRADGYVSKIEFDIKNPLISSKQYAVLNKEIKNVSSLKTSTPLPSSWFTSGLIPSHNYYVAYGNGTWVFIQTIENGLSYSKDNGATWTTIYPFDSSKYSGYVPIVFFKGYFVAIVQDKYVWVSADGINWEERTTLRDSSSGNGNYICPSIIDDKLYIYDRYSTYITEDLVKFTSVRGDDAKDNGRDNRGYFNKFGGKFLYAYRGFAYTTLDFTHWDEIDMSHPVYDIVETPIGLVGTHYTGTYNEDIELAVSKDGINWEIIDTGIGGTHFGLLYKNGLLFFVSSDYKIHVFDINDLTTHTTYVYLSDFSFIWQDDTDVVVAGVDTIVRFNMNALNWEYIQPEVTSNETLMVRHELVLEKGEKLYTKPLLMPKPDVGVNITLNGNQTANPSFYAPDTVGENSQILTSSGSTKKTPRWQNVSSITDEQNTTKTSMKSSVWKTKTWSGLTTFYGSKIWTDGENVYYSEGANQYVLNKVNSTWEPKTWSGLTSFDGKYIWSNGDNIYYSYNYDQFELDISTGTWKNKQWAGLGTSKINGYYIWSDGKTTYYSDGSKQYSLSFKNSQWYEKTWNGFSSYESTNFYGNDVWFDGTNIRYKTLALDVSTSTWNYKTGAAGMSDFRGRYVWTDGEHIYYSRYTPSGSTYSYMYFDKSRLTWLGTSWKGEYHGSGDDIWTDGENVYFSNGTKHLVLEKIARGNVNSKPYLGKLIAKDVGTYSKSEIDALLKSNMPGTSDFVTTDTAQTISGVKTFSNGVKVGSTNITYDSTNKCLKFTFD